MRKLIPYAGAEPKPERLGRAVLSLGQRRRMVAAWVKGATAEELADRYGVHPAYVRKAAARAGFRKREVPA